MDTNSTNNLKTILVFQGGGALGAYECGAFRVIASRIDKHQEDLAVVAGTSIGAVNASIIAKHYHKGGEKAAEVAADALRGFWTKVLPNPSLHIFPPYPGLQFPFAEVMQRYLDLWTSVLWGNQHIFTLDPRNLSPLAPHHYDMRALERTLGEREHFGDYNSKNEPRLIVTAVDVQAGHVVAFDSYKEQITPEKVVACCSIPPFMPAKKVDDKYYWDGGLWSNTPLGPVLNALQESDGDKQQSGTGAPEYRVYLINDHPHHGPLPQDFIGAQERTLDIMLADKTDYEVKMAEWLNRYIELVHDLYQHADLPPDVKEKIDNAYKKISGEKRAILHIVPLRRSGLPYDYWSGVGDFSPSRIEELIGQGERETQQQLEDRDAWDKEHNAWDEERNALKKERDALILACKAG